MGGTPKTAKYEKKNSKPAFLQRTLGSGLFMALQTGRHEGRQAIAHGLILVGTNLAI
jgi:hypothetical protein